MPARIVVVEGGKAGPGYWVEDEVVRVGSGPQCEVRVEYTGVPDHAATLEFAAGRYTLYNRSGGTIRLDGRDVADGSASPWAAGHDLSLADGLAVRLVVDGDPAPAKRPAAPVADDDEDEDEGLTPAEDGEDVEDDEEEGAEGSAAKTVVQLVVTLLCVAAIPVLLNYDKSHGVAGVHAEKAHATFDTLAKEVLKDQSRDDPGLRAILTTLQDARIAELRGKKNEARAALIRALEATESRRDAAGGYATKAEDEVDDYIRERLKNLSAPSP